MSRVEEPDLLYHQTPVGGQLTLVFDVQIHKKYGLLKPEVINLEVSRTSPNLKQIATHLESQLEMTNGSEGELLLKAVCVKARGRNRHLQDTSLSPTATSKRARTPSKWGLSGVVPLVCQQVWSNILLGYPEARLTILVNQHVPLVRVHTTSCMARFFNRELKYLDIGTFLPAKNLRASHVLGLCQDIFERGVRVKAELRKGVWPHLLGVFHPQLGGREERERYMGKLRMVYDHLKGKIMGESSDLFEKEQLVDAVHRDAIRTDPGHPFFADCRAPEESYISQHYHYSSDDSNIQKLINIIVIYTLEHGDISYTQGMTDILSPILYVMRDEADAYICFAAMAERIKEHFGAWCTGTLLKLERLRHLCEVLDPKLYLCLTSGIEEDPFALFFGMVLIECRREFSFDDSFHLLETIWAGVACSKNALPSRSNLSNARWARYMTYESPEVLQQVFEESGLPYTAVPLPRTMSGSYTVSYPYSRNPSLIMSHSPPSSAAAAAAHFVRKQSEIEPDVIPEHLDSAAATTASPIPAATPPGASAEHSSDSDSSVDAHRETIIIGGGGNSEQESARRQHDSLRPRSQSESNLKVLSAPNDRSALGSPYRISSASPQAGGVHKNNLSLISHKLGSSSYSHSESELYDSFSNSKVVRVLSNPSSSRHPTTEMSDMSSLSSGTASANGNLLSSMRSSVDGRRSHTRNGTPDSATGVRARHHSSTGGGADSGTSDSGTSDSSGAGSSKSSSPADEEFQDALYQPSLGVVDLASDMLLLEPETSSLLDNNAGGSPDTLVASRSPRKLPPPPPLPTSSPGCVGEGVATCKDPRTGANYVTTTAEVHHVEGGGLDIAELQQARGRVIERNGMITSTAGHKSPLVPHSHNKGRPPRPSSKYPLSDGEVVRKRKLVSSPKRIRRAWTPTERSNASSPTQYDSEVPSSYRVTPVAFFDAMEKMAESAPSRGALFPTTLRTAERREGEEGEEEEEEERDQQRQRADSEAEIGLLLSQLVSTEQGAPRVSSQESLSVPFSDCYSLFVCLSILVQNRVRIINSDADFYQLSQILNSQSAKQNLDRTLNVTHQLYRLYRKYQEMLFGPNGDYDKWVDDPVTT